jgi:hypothetical protein
MRRSKEKQKARRKARQGRRALIGSDHQLEPGQQSCDAVSIRDDSGLYVEADEPAGYRRLLNDAVQSAASWQPGTEDKFRVALAASELIDDRSTAEVWQYVATYLLWRAKTAPALLAARVAFDLFEHDRSDDDDGRAALDIMGPAFNDLGARSAMLACLALRHRRGDVSLPAVDRLVSTSDGWNPLQRWRRRHLLDKLSTDEGCRTLLDKAMRSYESQFPDFPRAFATGRYRFDAPEHAFDLVRKPHRSEHAAVVSLRNEYRFYRSCYRRRLLLPPLTLAVVLAALLLSFGTPSSTVGWIVAALSVAPPVGFLVWRWRVGVRGFLGLVRDAAIAVDLMEDTVALASPSTHRDALDILQAFAETGKPFALFLRSFEMEAQTVTEKLNPRLQHANDDQLFVIPDRFQQSVTHARPPSAVEQRLAQVLQVRLPTITVSNPAQIGHATQVTTLPKLELSNEVWIQPVSLIISAAQLIVVECVTLTAGVLAELEAIRNCGKSDHTVIVLPSAKTVSSLEQDRRTAFFAVDGVSAAPPIATADATELHGFDRLAKDDQLVTRSLDELAAFTGLLPQ